MKEHKLTKFCIILFVLFLFFITSEGSLVFGKKNLMIYIDNDENIFSEKTSVSLDSIEHPWPMQSHNTRHTGQSSYDTNSNDGTEKWRFYADGKVESGSIIDNEGTIYFGDWDYYFYAVYPDGTLKWKILLSGWIWSTPALSEDGVIYVGTNGHRLHAINSNGTLRWSFATSATVYSSPSIADDNTIYFGVMGPGDIGRIYALNPNGTEKWYYDTGFFVTSDPAIGPDGTIYCGALDRHMYAINPNGTLKWRYKTNDEIHGHASIAKDSTIYFGSFDDYLYALNPNGTLKWKYHMGFGPAGSCAIGNDGTVYVGTDKIYAINPDGSLKWEFELLNNRYVGSSSPALSADGNIYIGLKIDGGVGGEILALDKDGNEIWRSKRLSNEDVDSSPCIGVDGTVYIGSGSQKEIRHDAWSDIGYLHAFNTVNSNSPPNAPTITGRTQGNIGAEYGYKFSSVDPDNNPVSYFVDWGDSTNDSWTGGYKSLEAASGEIVILDHIYKEEGTYTLRAKTKDTLDAESEWTTLTVTMPKSYNLLSRFPLLERLWDIIN